MTSQVRLTFAKDAVPSHGSDDSFTDSLAQSVQTSWLIKCRRAIIVARAGLNGSSSRFVTRARWIPHSTVCFASQRNPKFSGRISSQPATFSAFSVLTVMKTSVARDGIFLPQTHPLCVRYVRLTGIKKFPNSPHLARTILSKTMFFGLPPNGT